MKKQEYQQEAKNFIDDVFAKIDELETKKDKIVGEAKFEYEKKIIMLKSKEKDLQEKYDDLINASDDKWEEVKSAFSSATDSFKEGLSKIKSLF